MSKRAADVLAETLEAAGVKRVYSMVGDSLNGFTDALRARGPARSTCSMRKVPLSQQERKPI